MKTKLLLVVFLMALLPLAAENYLKTVNVAVSGTLSSLISTQERGVITHLTVTGNIDARDVKYMRDDLGILAAIDLGGATIMSYSGTDGTVPASTVYPAGEMPEYSFQYPNLMAGKYSLQTIVLPGNLTSVGRYAFAYCSALKGTIMIPGTVTIIGERAFYYCDNISGLILGGSVGEIGVSAFGLCKKLTGELVIPGSVKKIGNSAFSDCSLLTGLSIGNAVENIGNYAFNSCTELSGRVTIPNSVKTIGTNCFNSCRKMTGLSIGNSVSVIGDAAFINCSGITGTVIIPESVTSIGMYAFMECPGITALSLGNAVTEWPDACFQNCTGLKRIEITRTVPPVLNSGTFTNVNKSVCALFVPAGSLNAYKSASYWKDFLNIAEGNLNSSVNDISTMDLKVYSVRNSLYIEGNIAGERISIFTADGKLCKRFVANSGKVMVELPAAGIYLIKAGKKYQQKMNIGTL